MTWPSSTDLPRFRRLLILGNLAVLVALVLATLQMAHTRRRAHEAQAHQTATSSARALSESVSAGFRHIDDGLRSTLKRLDALQAAGTPEPRELARVMEEERARMPAIDALRVTDASGLVLNPGDRPGMSMADRGYFRAARADPTQTIVSEPLRGRLIGGWGLAIARARTDAEGHFTGVVYASFKTERLRDELKRVDVGAKGAVTLRSRSLQLIARYSPLDANPDAGIGTAKVSAPLLAALAASPASGSFVSRTALDDVERVTAYESVPGYAMVLLVGLSTEAFQAAWRREVGLLAVAALLLQALLAAASVAVYRRKRAKAPEPG
jgi:hypothetical protein